MIDLITPNEGKLRRDWGLANVVGLEHSNPAIMRNNAHRMRRVNHKRATFFKTAVYPQQQTMPRQYATTEGGVRVIKILENREVDKVAGGGVRVVVEENLQQSRLIMSPLFKSKDDALQWALRNTGAKL